MIQNKQRKHAKYNKKVDASFHKEIEATVKTLCPYKMFCYSLNLVKEDLKRCPSLKTELMAISDACRVNIHC